MGRKSLGYEFVKEHIESVKGYKLLSKEYKNAKKHLDIQCPEGHIYKVIFAHFQEGCRCPICILKTRKRPKTLNKLTDEYMKQYVENEGYTFIKTMFGKDRKRIKVKCPKGHEYEVRFDHFKEGQRCAICKGKKKHTYKSIKEYIESVEGYKLLSKKYIEAFSYLDIQCPEGHKFKMKWNNFQQGQRCPICLKKEQSSEWEKYYVSYIANVANTEVIPNALGIITNPYTNYPLEYDCYLPEYKIAFEFDGYYWHGHDFPEQMEKDRLKDDLSKEIGINLIRIKENIDIKSNYDDYYIPLINNYLTEYNIL